MNEVLTTAYFSTRYKRLAKKFQSLETDVETLVNNLLENPTLGKSLGAGLYKIRIATQSKGGGKSGGFRCITYLINQTETDGMDIYLITIYDKSEDSNISKKVLESLVKALEI